MIKKIKLRTLLIGGVITLFFLLLIGRIFWLQVIDNDFWKEKALDNFGRQETITASRGTISDRDGDVLAMDAPAYTIAVNPRVIQANGLEDEVVKGLNKVLNKDEEELRKIVRAKNKEGEYHVYREIGLEGWKVNEDKKNEIVQLRDELESQLRAEGKVPDSGISIITDKKRVYPQNTLAAHVLGYTDRDGVAKDGFEKYFDNELKGEDGFAKYQSDKKGVRVPSADEVYKPAKNGKNFMLTIDDTIQYYIEDAMREAYEKYNPLSMTVIAADPNTMEILGMANMPTFDPNEYWNTPDMANFYNHAVMSTYEPGSTFKIVTLASAIEENLFNPEAKYMSGSIRAGGRTHYDVVPWGWGEITYLEGVKRSSNVAFVKLGYEMLGKERLKQYINAFGFNEKTDIDLPGEVVGQLNMERDIDISTVPYGYAVSVTPIQQIAAVSAVANGGKLMKPQIVKQIEDPNTGEITKIAPEVVRQVISPETARETGEYLEQVVADQKHGSGRLAYIDGYRVAGKTGTAIKGDYRDRNKVVASFIGYAPVDDPKIAVYVIIDEPNVQAGGGEAAAPVFQKIVSQTLNYWGIPKNESKEKSGEKNNSSASTERKAPKLEGMKVSEVKTKLLAEGFVFETLGKGSTVKQQYPPANEPIEAGQRIYLLTEENDKMKIPDLRGESLRDALEVLNLMKVKVHVQGEGYVVDQKEGTENGKRVVYLTLKPAEDTVKKDKSSSSDGAKANEKNGKE
ncbi:penicillin-binding transpeptidase domain-containing protein [Paenibacillus faecalis]|uniref:penicillin-binding transpeptidase domain-containing protein n=1 Tax=Paenibacillus faecalis TaxID=2079532 RepID=UPI000D11306A|nr:penicillin-binding transpeptidase domain-containing protein [Paenibacillus faecalis]